VDIGTKRIHHPDRVAAGEEFTHSMLADEAGAAGDENFHACPALLCSLPRAD
jgi:hypothetical protein